MTNILFVEACFKKGGGYNGDEKHFEKFFIGRVPEWKGLASAKPTVLILASSAIRSVNLLKFLPSVRGRLTIAKLFAKHFRLHEQKAFLASHRSPAAIGTPARILKLVQDDEAPIDANVVEHIFIDTHRDGKDRTVFDVPEVRKEFLDLLCRTPIRGRVLSGAIQLHFF